MSTLTEIEAAADALSPKQREALLKYLTERPPQQQAIPKKKRSTLAEFRFNLYELNGEVENRHWHGV